MENRSEGAEPVFDRKDFLERVEGDMELARQLGEMFIEDAHEKLAMLRESVGKQDAEELIRTAHSLKGASANMSAVRLRKMAVELEQAARNEKMTEAAGLIETLETALADFESALKSQIFA